MLTVTTTDSKKRERVLQISGFVKPSGIVVARVVNDDKKTYFVQLRPDGDTCTCESRRRCYHIKAVKAVSLPTFEEVTATPDEIAAVAEERNMQKLAEYRRHVAKNAYEQLAVTKKVASQRQVSDIEARLTRRGLMK